MEAQREVYRHIVATLALRVLGRAGEKRINPLAARHIVVVVIILHLGVGIDRVCKTCILQPIPCSLSYSWIAAGLRLYSVASLYLHRRTAGRALAILLHLLRRVTRNIAHSAAKLYTICRNNQSLGGKLGIIRCICKIDTLLGIALCKGKTAKAYPGIAAHLLINQETLLPAAVLYFVLYCRRAVWKSFVGDIDSILATLRHICNPNCL